MNTTENKLSEYIDRLNAERKPSEHKEPDSSGEYGELLETVRLIRTVKEPSYPDGDFSKRLASGMKAKLAVRKTGASRTKWLIRAAAAAAVLTAVIVTNALLPGKPANMAAAMEKAYGGLKAYHGTMEIVEMNGLKEESLQAQREVWADKDGNYYVKELKGANAGLITVNNGTQKWQLDQERKQVSLYSAFPDSYRFTLELGKEIEDVKNAIDIKILGDDTVAGRKAVKLLVTPAGGTSYYLWTDKETNLPLQKETPLQNAVGYRVTYTDIDFLDAIPAEQTGYMVPAGYQVVDNSEEQIVSNLEEAKSLTGFSPVLPAQVPEGYEPDTVSVSKENTQINRYYTSGRNTLIYSQEKTTGGLDPDSNAILGKVNGNPAEIITSADQSEGILNGGSVYAGASGIASIRWQANGFEFTILGDMKLAELKEITEAAAGGKVLLPEQSAEDAGKPQIKAPVDLEIEENEQKSADAGHSPWRLDPVFVAQVYVGLLISPEGIAGDYPIQYEDITITENSGTAAVAEIHNEKSPAARVYLKKLIRQDSTGIWTAVGYDPAE